MANNTWLILGASSAIAREFARHAAKQGCQLILAGRDIEDMKHTAADIHLRYQGQVTVMPFNALDIDSQAAFVMQCRDAYPDHTLNIFIAVGSMPEQSDMDHNAELSMQTMQTNYLAIVTLLQHFAPVFEQQKAGHICVLGSVAGDRGRKKNYLYGSSKAALHVYCEGLRAHLYPLDVSVTLVKPGFIDTALTYGMPGLFLVASPSACAKACFSAATKGKDSIYFPWFWHYIMLIIKLIPNRLFKTMTI